jgi:hypothetical protein
MQPQYRGESVRASWHALRETIDPEPSTPTLPDYLGIIEGRVEVDRLRDSVELRFNVGN